MEKVLEGFYAGSVGRYTMNYRTLLKNAPRHDSPGFITYLRKNNPVVFENPQWIVIENFKYHTEDRPWWTAFHKAPPKDVNRPWYADMDILWYEFGDHEWIKKSASKQTVKRFHIHVIPKGS